MSCIILVTTYKKSLALDNLLESLIKNDYGRYDLVVADDYSNKVDSHGSSAGGICKKYKGQFKSLTFCYNEKTSQAGIAKNKNRGLLQFYKNQDKYDSVLMLDDDLIFINPGLIDHLQSIGANHVNGYWTDYDVERVNSPRLVGLSGNNWHSDFGIKAETEHLTWHQGTQGCMVYMTKEILLKLGYMNPMPYHYGMEHSAFSARANRLEGWDPELFPVMKGCHRYFIGNNVANDYSISHDKINTIQTDAYRQILKDVYNGVNLKVEQPGLPKKGEKVIII